jgi:hypothetical protein
MPRSQCRHRPLTVPVPSSPLPERPLPGAERKLILEIGRFRFCPIPLNKSSFEVIAASGVGDRGHAGERRAASGC